MLKGGTKLLKGGTKLLKGGTKLLKGGTKLLKGGTKLLKGGTKSLGWATGGGRTTPPTPPPLATGLGSIKLINSQVCRKRGLQGSARSHPDLTFELFKARSHDPPLTLWGSGLEYVHSSALPCCS